MKQRASMPTDWDIVLEQRGTHSGSSECYKLMITPQIGPENLTNVCVKCRWKALYWYNFPFYLITTGNSFLIIMSWPNKEQKKNIFVFDYMHCCFPYDRGMVGWILKRNQKPLTKPHSWLKEAGCLEQHHGHLRNTHAPWSTTNWYSPQCKHRRGFSERRESTPLL